MVGLGEGGEVMPAAKQGSRIGHRLDIQPVLDPPDVTLVEGGLAGGDLVDVGTSDSIVAGMEVWMGLFGGEYHNVRGKGIVEFAPEALGG